MTYKSLSNTNLIVRKTVVLTPRLDTVISTLDSLAKRMNIHEEITSGSRSPEMQLQTIIDLCHNNGMGIWHFTNTDVDSKLSNGNYIWQESWSLLLERGIIVNPPRAAMVLESYIDNGVQKRGTIIQPSSHIKGEAFDKTYRESLDSSKKIDRLIETAIFEMPELKILNFRIEPLQGCTHTNISLT